jgi:hypothetical protein
MAVKLKEFDFKSASKLTTAPKGDYPWDKWFDGDIWMLTEGEDFQGHPLMMERVIRTSATNQKVKVNMRHVAMNGEPWGKIVLQRNDIIGPMAAKKAERAAIRASKKAPTVTPAKAKVNGAAVKRPSKRPARASA